MKRILGIFLALCMLCGMAMAQETAALTQDVVVLFTSDVHCGIDQGFGYVGLAAIRDAMKAVGNHVLLVDNGDSIQGEPIGTMTTGEANIQLMNAVGYDMAIPGNHEFDYGMERFLELTEKAAFPYISANFNKNGELVFAPYVMKEFDGVKIAFVGMTTPKTITSSTPKYFQNEAGEFIYGFMQDETGEKLYAAVQSAVDAARAEGAA
ncbi:MAG: metallophosphoesterase, partial [Clostridia bacterium]|nr:metallophosphoesterase [Clostridia bacterium]